MKQWLTGPTAVAVAVTLLNAVKPAAVDDTAYLEFARHLAANPGDPYGFEIFWYSAPEPAMGVLLPPVLPYWLALGRGVAGDHLFLLKLTLLPFSLVLCHSLAFLFGRFAPGAGPPLLAMTVLGPGVLPFFGVMLDVPALALGLSAVACFIRGCDTERVGWVAGAGVLAGLAAQTKYSMLPVPAVLLWYAVLHRQPLFGVGAGAFAVAVFAGWESFVEARAGESHFLHHLREQQASRKDWLDEKWNLFQPMVAYLGGTAVGFGLLAGRAIRLPRAFVAAVAGAGALGVAAVCVVPYSDSIVLRKPNGGVKLELATLVFGSLGTGVLLASLGAAGVLLLRPRGLLRFRRLLRWNADSWFVAGWVAIELAAYFALTPFPAGRRVIGIGVALAVLAGRTAVLTRLPVPQWIVASTIAAGIGLFGLDTWDSFPERQLALRAADRVGDPGLATVWFNGHWGFQYYCDRAGMKPVEPGVSVLKAGDWLVFPVIPDDRGFYRPYHGGAKFRVDPASAEPVDEYVWEDSLAAQTIPELYGGTVPVRGRDHPRLRVAVYRVTREWIPERVK